VNVWYKAENGNYLSSEIQPKGRWPRGTTHFRSVH